MGLFDKKKNGAEASQPVAVPVGASQPTAVPSLPADTGPSPRIEAAREDEHPDFGINKAIELMRRLPDDNMELIVCVVKTTLESTNIKVKTIINDATRKQGQLEGRIEVLAREIAGFEAEVAVRKREIAALEADYKETSTVKEWLVVAETLSGPHDAGKPKDAAPVVQQAAAPSSPAPSSPDVDAKK